MKIKKLQIKNFRGIREMCIDFHPRLNVFAGKNGIGKTTILNALGKTIDVARLNHVAGNERKDLESIGHINKNDILINEKYARINLQFLFRNKKITTTASSSPEEISSDLFTHFPEAGILLPHRTFSEYRSTITGTYVPNVKIRNMISGIDPLIASIIDDTTRYAYSFAWISDREDLENNRFRKFYESGKDFKHDHFEKDKILQSVKKVINDITGFSGLFNDREKYGFTIDKNVGTGKDTLLFSQLSSGEQHIISFIASIAVNFAVNFPESENPMHKQAVFMIDAIELHLHPSWQREIIPKLLESFPNCQFIITTHSPQVLGNVKRESVFLLKRADSDIVCENPDESYGMTMNRLLELVMEDESRPAEDIRKQLEILFENITRKKLDKALTILKELKKEIPTDYDVTRAEMLLHNKGIKL